MAKVWTCLHCGGMNAGSRPCDACGTAKGTPKRVEVSSEPKSLAEMYGPCASPEEAKAAIKHILGMLAGQEDDPNVGW